MAHQSLYRTYRPQHFKDVVGQEEVINPLSEQIKAGKIGHAYLFAGSRGLGKTSIARIFARELGCTENDLYEIDAASHNGVDHIRSIAENVFTLPFESPYKVYIFDEAHMLSKGAWNAFLKTLEEPPAHAIFILATTELEKVPETVQSRCQVFTFRKPTRPGLAKLVASIAKKEGYTLEPSVADLVALLGNGSYRDALSVLEKVLSVSADTKITRAEAEKATGSPRHVLVENLVTSVAEGNAEQALLAVRKADEEGVDLNLFLSLVLEQMRMVLLVRHAPELRKELSEELGEEAYAEVKRVSEHPGSKLTHQSLKVFLDAASRIRFSPIPALAIELAILELLGQD